MSKHLALAVFAPVGKLIAQGRHRIDLRSWQPPELPLLNLVIVEAQRQVADEQEQALGLGVALVDVLAVRPWQGATGMWAWQLSNARPLSKLPLPVSKGLYVVELRDAEQTT